MRINLRRKFIISENKYILTPITKLNENTFGNELQRINIGRESLKIPRRNDSAHNNKSNRNSVPINQEENKQNIKNHYHRKLVQAKKKQVTFEEDQQDQNSYTNNKSQYTITENNSFATLGNQSSCQSLDLYKCILCNTSIETIVIQLSCLHSYHENCLKDLIQSQINRKNQIIVQCECKKQVKLNIIMQYCPQFLIIILHRQLEHIKANNNKIVQSCQNCNFFIINNSQSSVQSFCPNCTNFFS